MKKPGLILAAFAVACLVVYTCRVPILRSFAWGLIQEDSLHKADALIVLSGGGYDRGNRAVALYNAGYAPKIICTGGNKVIELIVLTIDTLESEMTVANLKRQTIPDSAIILIPEGTSTKEEAALVLNYCKTYHLHHIIVLSSKLHTGRAGKVWRKVFANYPIHITVQGAPSSRFNELEWWKSEDGLIAVNNEWLKTIYYFIKY